MMTSSMITAAVTDDAELVGATLAGNRDAFGRIVSRYQSLICSLAYSATGSLGQSEDLAQETFITAWKHLGHLRERDKLRAWLCGIARNRINNFLRREGREPIREAAPLEDAAESHAPEPLPVDHTISREEAQILWRSLERIPEIYREPLVLFYREHQSIETVAANLELTEDTVKQRLSRGRKMLQEQVLAFVEGALSRTTPSATFTLAVLAALPAMTYSAKAATIGTAAAKGAGGVKAVGALGWLGTILSPLLTFFGFYSSYRMTLDEARTDRERKGIQSMYRRTLLITLVFSVLAAGPLYWVCRGEDHFIMVFASLLFSQAVVVYLLVLLISYLSVIPLRRLHLGRELAEEHGGNFPASAYEYRSRATLFGLPLVHVRIGDRFDILRGPVKAWIAVGSSHAVGVIFASGAMAVAPIAFGGLAIGIVSFGAIAVGVFPLGAIAIGGWAYGGLAFGWQIFCGVGAAWNAATGGIVAAHDFADGGIARALQANTHATADFIGQHLFFRIARVINNHGLLVMLAWIIPTMLQARLVARAKRLREQKNS